MTKKHGLFIGILVLYMGAAHAQMAGNLGATSSDSPYHQVAARKNATEIEWKNYTAKTIDRLPGFTVTKDPKTNKYGSWEVNQSTATGFFRVEKKANRWWIIDPEGYPFIHKGVAVFRPASSPNQWAALKTKYGTEAKWLEQETEFLKKNGFNGTGAWSSVDLMREQKKPLVYTVIVSPMGAYKSQHRQKFGGNYKQAG